jgi:hypothetical protein
VRAILACRTAALGGHVEACDRCEYRRVSYNSCRNRHCPKCQGEARARWLRARNADLLPVEYFHVVFTVPEQIAEIALRNKRRMYAALFRAAWATLRTIAADEKHLGAEIGALMVLHTWGQTLVHHPHVHCVVPGGGLTSDGRRWVRCRRGYFLPVRVLSALFRRLLLEDVARAARRGELKWVGGVAELADPTAFARLLGRLRKTKWVVYAKRPFGGPEQVLEYLGRYTHKVAITNHRLVALWNGEVTFRWQDYRTGNPNRTMRLSVDEFIRRFLQHVLPAGFQRIRQYGVLGNRCRRTKLARCRELLESQAPRQPCRCEDGSEVDDERPMRPSGRECPACGEGQLYRVGDLEPAGPAFVVPGTDEHIAARDASCFDTS